MKSFFASHDLTPVSLFNSITLSISIPVVFFSFLNMAFFLIPLCLHAYSSIVLKHLLPLFSAQDFDIILSPLERLDLFSTGIWSLS